MVVSAAWIITNHPSAKWIMRRKTSACGNPLKIAGGTILFDYPVSKM